MPRAIDDVAEIFICSYCACIDCSFASALEMRKRCGFVCVDQDDDGKSGLTVLAKTASAGAKRP